MRLHRRDVVRDRGDPVHEEIRLFALAIRGGALVAPSNVAPPHVKRHPALVRELHPQRAVHARDALLVQRERPLRPRLQLRHLLHNLGGRRAVDLGHVAGGVDQHERPAGVAARGQVRDDGHLEQVRDAVVVAYPLTAALAEGLVSLPVVAVEVAHVLDDGDARNAQLAEHAHALLHVDERQFLRRGDHDGGGDGQHLADGELHVARARGHVDDQVVQVAPRGGGQHLVDETGHHGPAHDRGALTGEPERHDADALVLRRRDGSRLFVHLQHRLLRGRHRGKRRAEDVGVEDPNLGAHHPQRVREVHGRRGLSHAPLARGHRDDVPDALQALDGVGHVIGHGLRGHVDVARLGPLQRRHELSRQAIELLLDRARGGGELQGERDVAGVGYAEILDESAVDDVLAKVRVDDVAESVQDVRFPAAVGRGRDGRRRRRRVRADRDRSAARRGRSSPGARGDGFACDPPTGAADFEAGAEARIARADRREGRHGVDGANEKVATGRFASAMRR